MRGGVGRLEAPVAGRVSLAHLIDLVLDVGYITKKVLEIVCGLVAYAFGFRRELLALLQEAYRIGAAMDSGVWTALGPVLSDELRAVRIALPFARTDLRAQVSRTVIATDATPTAGGAVRARVPADVAGFFYRFVEERGSDARLHPSALDSIVPPDLRERDGGVDAVAAACPWGVTASYKYRSASHINLQEARAVCREVCELSATWSGRPSRMIFLNDSQVCVGAFTKGRSSSRKLNPILRANGLMCVAMGLVLNLVWISTNANPADYPSRFRPLPPPAPVPYWAAALFNDAAEPVPSSPNLPCAAAAHATGKKGGGFPGCHGQLPPGEDFLAVTGSYPQVFPPVAELRAVARVAGRPGLEVFSGGASLTKAFREEGVPMLEPWDLLAGRDALDPTLDAIIKSGKVGWVWIAPPCTSFSSLYNMRSKASLGNPRTRDNPWGDEAHPRIKEGNRLWRRTLQLLGLCHRYGVGFVLEHPQQSWAWRLPESIKIFNRTNAVRTIFDQCMFGQHSGTAGFTKKATSLVHSGQLLWIKAIERRCDRSHVHQIVQGRAAAKASGAYPPAMCHALAAAYVAGASRPRA